MKRRDKRERKTIENVKQMTLHWFNTKGVTSCHCSSVLESPRIQSSIDGTVLLTYRRDRVRSASTVGIGPQWPSGLILSPVQCNLPTHHSHSALDKPHVLPIEDIHNSGVDQMPYSTHHSSKETGELFPKTEKHVPPQGGKTGAGCMGSLSLAKGVFQAQGPALYKEIRPESLQAPDGLSQQQLCGVMDLLMNLIVMIILQYVCVGV